MTGFGALEGVLLGPAGVVVGATIGAAGGGLVGGTIDLAQFYERPADVGKALEHDTSALMLWTEPNDVDAFVANIRSHGGKLLRSSLSEKQARKLKAALRSEL